MIYSEEYKEHIEYTFAAFCKVVLRNASMSAYRDIGRWQKREISLDYLMEEKYYNPSTTDSYFEEQTSAMELIVCGEKIVIENERLAKVFSDLPKLRQEVLVLYFFFGYTDKKIGEMYGKSRTTVNYWKIAALKQLRKEMERLEHEEQENGTF
ncbi:MAG: sigma-70 family RNA polymerase sigma factor [Lachnospiraceae bacterium]|nr:sigma-70 family RNA polymerase sigma factor [Lachnospiraceae bacterium]